MNRANSLVGRNLINIPERCDYNPIISLLEEIQVDLGFTVVHPGLCLDSPSFSFSLPHTLSAACLNDLSLECSVFHLHWPEKLYRMIGNTAFFELLHHVRQRGAKIVLTMHNLSPHEKNSADSDATGSAVSYADVLHVFSSSQAQALEEIYGYKLPVKVAPHPNYKTSISSDSLVGSKRCSLKSELRKKYNLAPDLLTFALAGRLRAYKHINALLTAIRLCPKLHAQFVFAGLPDDHSTVDDLLRAERNDSRIHLYLKFLTALEYEEVLLLSDFAVLPYVAWSSGFAIHASNLSVPLIGYPPMMFNMIGSGQDFGFFVDGCRYKSLASALVAASEISVQAICEMGDRARLRFSTGPRSTILREYKSIYMQACKP